MYEKYCLTELIDLKRDLEFERDSLKGAAFEAMFFYENVEDSDDFDRQAEMVEKELDELNKELHRKSFGLI